MKLKEFTGIIKREISAFLKTDGKTSQLILNIIIILMLNIAAASIVMRIDLTGPGAYSLSQKSIDIVGNLHEKLKIKVFFSEDLPAGHSAVSRYLDDLLQEYSFHGNRNFSYEIVPPDKLEKEAADYGIRPVESREFASDQIRVRNVYMSLVIQHGDLIEKIEALTSSEGLEYEITSRIEKMTSMIDRLVQMNEPLRLTLYLDPRLEKLPINGIDRVKSLVSKAAEQSSRSNYGKIKLDIVNPAELGKENDPVKIYGIPGLRWKSMRAASGEFVKSGETGFGLVLRGESGFRVIDINFIPGVYTGNDKEITDLLQDRINIAVGNLLSSSRDLAYVVGHGIPELRDERNPEGAALFNELLSGMYNPVEVDLKGDDIPDTTDVMIINGPVTEFSEEEKYKVDQFLMRGGSLLYFANSFIEVNPGQVDDLMGGRPMVVPVSSGLEPLLEHYGVKINRDVVLDKSCARVPIGNMISDYPLMPVIREEGLNRNNIATRYINSALLIKASSLESTLGKDQGKAEYYELVSTSPESWTMEGRVNFDPGAMIPPGGDAMKSRTVAALVSGKFSSYYKEKEKPAGLIKPGLVPEREKLEETVGSGESRILVVGSSEITTSAFIDYAGKAGTAKNGGYSNNVLLHSFVDYLSGNHFVPEMKSKSISSSPLERTDEKTRFLLKGINMGMLPLFIVLSGFVVWRRRIARKMFIEKEFTEGAGK